MKFPVKKGTNVSHWLSQSTERGQTRRAYFTENDVEKIASLGFDHIRLPLDEEQMWDEAGAREQEAFELLGNALEWSDRHGLNSVHTYDALRVPKDDNLILTFHYYHPMLVTHYQARWWDGGEYAGPVTYPGSPIPADHFATLDAATRTQLEKQNTPFDRDVMRRDIAKPVAVAKQHGYPIYCGEFGCYNKTPEPLRDAWYRDVLAVFDEYSVGWANWDYKGNFGIVDQDGTETPVATYLTTCRFR